MHTVYRKIKMLQHDEIYEHNSLPPPQVGGERPYSYISKCVNAVYSNSASISKTISGYISTRNHYHSKTTYHKQ